MNHRLLQLTQVLALGMVLASAQNAKASCGTVEVSKGDVKIQAAGKSAVAAPAGAKICSGDTIIAAADSRAKVKLEDGNELNISPSSTIVIENFEFNAAENKKKIMLNVLMGKVRATTPKENMYGDKAKDGKTNTFQVKTKSAVAGVRGTDFLTGFDPKTSKSEVVTFRGKVEVGQPGPGGTILKPVFVGAGQKTEAVSGQPPAPAKVVPPAELKKMNSESKAETGGSTDKSAGGGSAKKDDKKDDKKDGDKKSPGDAKSDDKGGDKSAGDKSGGDKSSDGSAKSGDDGGGKSAKGPGGGGGDSGNRSPASISPGSMISTGDASTGAISNGGTVALPNAGPSLSFNQPLAPPPPPHAPDLPAAVNNAIQGGVAKVKIVVCVNGKCS
jgi:hypothetical protein